MARGPLSWFGTSTLVLATLVLLAAPSAAEPDRLVRTFLDVSSIPVRFAPPEGKPLKDGKFVGYGEFLLPPIERLHSTADRPNYEAELGWAPKDGKYGYFLVTPGGTQGFREDAFFQGLGSARHLALNQPPGQMLGPFSVLGFAAGGSGTPLKGAKSEDVRDAIRGKFRVAAFLVRFFETEDQARAFANSLPKLSAE